MIGDENIGFTSSKIFSALLKKNPHDRGRKLLIKLQCYLSCSVLKKNPHDRGRKHVLLHFEEPTAYRLKRIPVIGDENFTSNV